MAPRWAPRFRFGTGGEGVATARGVDRCVATQKAQLCGGRRERALAVLAVAEPEFRRTARRVSLCTDDAEDAFQRAVEILLTKAPERPPNALIAWMQVVTRREALAVRRARERILAAWRDDGNELFDGLLCERPGVRPRTFTGPGPRPMSRRPSLTASAAILLAAAVVGGRRHGGPHALVELAPELVDQRLLVLRDLRIALGDELLAEAWTHAEELHRRPTIPLVPWPQGCCASGRASSPGRSRGQARGRCRGGRP